MLVDGAEVARVPFEADTTEIEVPDTVTKLLASKQHEHKIQLKVSSRESLTGPVTDRWSDDRRLRDALLAYSALSLPLAPCISQ